MTGSRLMHWIFCSIAAALVVAGCTSDTTSSESTGALNLNLELAPGVDINEVDWTITSPGMEPMAGTINTSPPGATASVEVFGLPPGDDYNVELTATSEDATVTCGGDADFEVEVGETTPIMVMLNCKRPERLGGVRVNGKFNICADLAKVVVAPLQTSVGNDIDLAAIANDVEGDPVTYIWTGDGGIIDDPTDPTTTYTCASPGIGSVTITVTDDEMEYCVDSWTVPVRCVEGDVDLCEDVPCNDGKQCTDNDCNPATGVCINDPVQDGTSCDVAGLGDGVCDGGECIEVDLCEGDPCNDGKECTLDLCDDETGDCSNPSVDNGTDCNGDAGMCVEGECIDIEICDDMDCPPTASECTVSKCSLQTNACEEMNVPNGDDCDGGAGMCSDGLCVDKGLCEPDPCLSQSECVDDGTCDPTDASCTPGDNKPEGADCTIGGSVCDGNGACVECNNAATDCDPAEQCFVSTCVDNTCGAETAPDGSQCDWLGIDDGVCDAGECVEPPECITTEQCPDMVCTSKDCVSGMCEYTPTDGVTCEVEPGLPGMCDGNDCIGLCVGKDCPSLDDCVMDGACDDQSGECIPGDPVGAGEQCDLIGLGDGVCDGAGTCVRCNDNTDCNEDEICTDNVCAPGAVDPDPKAQVITTSCGNNVTADVSILPYLLSVDPGPVAAGQSFAATLGGVAEFSEQFLDAAQGAVTGGVTSAGLVDIIATVQTRGSGATGDDVPLSAGSDLPFNCIYTGGDCDPANNKPSVPGIQGNTDCLGNKFDPCLQVVIIPTSSDCDPGGECDTLDKASQCSANGFCVTGGLPLPLDAGTGTYTAGATASTAQFGWYDQPADASSGVGTPAVDGDGTWNMLQPTYTGVAGPVGLAVNAGGLTVQLECVMGIEGGADDDGDTIPDDGRPTPDTCDADALAFPGCSAPEDCYNLGCAPPATTSTPMLIEFVIP